MKLNSFILVTALALTACQKKSDDPKATAKPQDKPAPADSATKTSNSVCSFKEVVKYISEKDGSVTRETYESTSKFVGVSTLTAKKDNQRSYDISSELVSEGFTTDNAGVKKQTSKIDYTSSGTRVTTAKKIDEKTISQQSKTDVTRVGRNGYKFKNEDNTMSDSKKFITETDMTVVDDGETSYYLKYEGTVNGKKIIPPLDEIERYRIDGKVTKSVITLKEPRVIKNAAGVVIQETEFYEENCTKTVE